MKLTKARRAPGMQMTGLRVYAGIGSGLRLPGFTSPPASSECGRFTNFHPPADCWRDRPRPFLDGQ
ncbi:hypothetical protein AGR2A_Cc110142 [Agrobacterium genomosp. 2 str. CFBP 5494]|uniref:Uncharacterized protein n=1 Tax=Agrobacterium genomosp. 2 str. CFBP 5494 TaxID=1183436 RepID=A0A9W5EYT9_9HYPH|nr:hypothetical protein AGR2A_Cc110142 [Agrobacterium genomosp. 2 str. CFBP 5494]